MLELSLRKLGWLMPIYAISEGEIISGHQRHHVATQMGLKKIPVAVLPKKYDLNRRKAVNILFNRPTNDQPRQATLSRLAERWSPDRFAPVGVRDQSAVQTIPLDSRPRIKLTELKRGKNSPRKSPPDFRGFFIQYR